MPRTTPTPTTRSPARWPRAAIVLLKNDDASCRSTAAASVAVIGEFAPQPRYQGAGISQINPTRLDNALDGLRALAGEAEVHVRRRASPRRRRRRSPPSSRAEAVGRGVRRRRRACCSSACPRRSSPRASTATTSSCRPTSSRSLDAVVAANPRTVVVLSNGGVVRLGAVADRRAARSSRAGCSARPAAAPSPTCSTAPSTRRAGSPRRSRCGSQDSPAYLDFPGEHGHVRYGEGLFVGYRWYDARDLEVAYPFGHGLSYTTFAYSDLVGDRPTRRGLAVSVTVTNTGERDGREVVQVYTGAARLATWPRPPRELKAFASVALGGGREPARSSCACARADLAYWDIRIDRWVVEGGVVRRRGRRVEPRHPRHRRRSTSRATPCACRSRWTRRSASSWRHPVASQIVMQAMSALGDGETAGLMADPGLFKMMESFPIGRLASFPGMGLGREQVEQLLAASNAQA